MLKINANFSPISRSYSIYQVGSVTYIFLHFYWLVLFEMQGDRDKYICCQEKPGDRDSVWISEVGVRYPPT